MAFPKFSKQTTMWGLTLSNDSFLPDCHISHFTGQASETWKGFRTVTETTDGNYTTTRDNIRATHVLSDTGTSRHNSINFLYKKRSRLKIAHKDHKVHNQLLRAKRFIPLSSVRNEHWCFRTWQPFPVVTFGRTGRFRADTMYGPRQGEGGGYSCHPGEVRGVRGRCAAERLACEPQTYFPSSLLKYVCCSQATEGPEGFKTSV